MKILYRNEIYLLYYITATVRSISLTATPATPGQEQQ
nr:MAG TPA: hypothetical protein [Caudoviricetes sp.]